MPPQTGKQREEQLGNPVQSAVETAAAQHVWNVTMLTQILTGQTKIASEIQHRHDRGSHYLGIRHLALLIFIVVQGFQHIITQAKNDYNLRVHEFLLTLKSGYLNCNRKLMDFPIPATLGGNLGYIMKLEGFIFFGTANGIFERLREHVKSALTNEVKYCMFDFSKVIGIDSTGMLSFARLMQWSQEQGVILVFVGLEVEMQKLFIQENSTIEGKLLKFFADADHGIEWCENEIIAANLADLRIEREISEQLKAILMDDNVEKLIPYSQPRDYGPGEYLIREGDAADFMYFIQSGQVTAQLESPGKNPVRLETIHSGRTVGEIAFFLGTRRTASVVANQYSVVYSLSMEDLKRMESSDPESANLFHRLSVILLSQRVMHLTYTVRALENS